MYINWIGNVLNSSHTQGDEKITGLAVSHVPPGAELLPRYTFQNLDDGQRILRMHLFQWTRLHSLKSLHVFYWSKAPLRFDLKSCR